jgi:hypothetical protein
MPRPEGRGSLLLPPQTVKTAVENLKEIDAIESRYSVNDVRERVYCLNR